MNDEQCVFCAIAGGRAAAHVVFEDEISLAFLDRRPVFAGHCLLVPKAHYVTLPDLPAGLLEPFFANAQLLARAVEEAMEADGTFVAMNNRVSQSVKHLHLHVVPRRYGDGLRGFFWPRHPYESREEAERVREDIREAVRRLRLVARGADQS